MAGAAQRNVFDDLNVALSAQIDKLQSIDPADGERMHSCIEQSKAVAVLAGNINRNTKNALDCLRLQNEIAETQGKGILIVPKLLSGEDDA